MEDATEQNKQGTRKYGDDDSPTVLEIDGIIKMLKNNKSPGQDNTSMMAELFKYGGERLVGLIKDL